MIELLGAGVPRENEGWLLHRVCTQIDSAALTVIASRRADERSALLDIVSGRRVPDEGRVWVDGLPLMSDTRHRIRQRVLDLDLAMPFDAARTVSWNVMRRSTGFGGMIRFPGRRHRAEISRALDLAGLGTMAREPVRYLDEPGRVRVAIAVALMVGKAHVIVREPLTGLKPADAAGIAVELKRLAEISRHCVVTSGERAELLVDAADRVLALDDGLLVYDGPPRPFAERRVYSRLIS